MLLSLTLILAGHLKIPNSVVARLSLLKATKQNRSYSLNGVSSALVRKDQVKCSCPVSLAMSISTAHVTGGAYRYGPLNRVIPHDNQNRWKD